MSTVKTKRGVDSGRLGTVLYRVLVYGGKSHQTISRIDEKKVVWEGDDPIELSILYRRGLVRDSLENCSWGAGKHPVQQYYFQYKTPNGEWTDCADPRHYVFTPEEWHRITYCHREALKSVWQKAGLIFAGAFFAFYLLEKFLWH